MLKHTLLIWAIVLHHTQVVENQSPQEITSYQKRHGHPEIAYHFYIEQNGNVYSGVPLKNRGSHAAGRNNGTIGICLSGDFSKNKPTDSQLKSLVDLIAHLKRLPIMSPEARIMAHSDVMKIKVGQANPVNDYDCPGNLLKYLSEYVESNVRKGKIICPANTTP